MRCQLDGHGAAQVVDGRFGQVVCGPSGKGALLVYGAAADDDLTPLAITLRLFHHLLGARLAHVEATSRVRRLASQSVSSTVPQLSTPALATTMSRCPKCATVVATICATASRSATSPAHPGDGLDHPLGLVAVRVIVDCHARFLWMRW